MRTKTEVTAGIDLDAPVMLEAYIPEQATPLIVNGPTETLVALAQRQKVVKTHKLPQTAVERPVEPENAPEPHVSLYGRQYIKDTLKAKIFDLRWKTDEYGELEAARLAERRLRLRSQLGTGVIERCAKHRHQLADLRRTQ